MFSCCICGESLEGITIHDFRFDENRTRIDWQFCPNHSILVGLRTIQHALRPDEWAFFMSRAGMTTFMLHDDFYDEDGRALQPMG